MHFNFSSFKQAFNPKNISFSLLIKWFIIILLSGILIGSISALFLYVLEEVTSIRGAHSYLLYGLPVGGFLIGLLYYYYGKEANQGNNLIISEYHTPSKTIPFKMFTLVLLGTWVTHLFGGSAGREGTAVQMGGTIADQLNKYLHLGSEARKTILLMGVSAGFASVFGTPIAGIFFAFELMLLRNFRLHSVLPVVMTAYISHYSCIAWGIHHTMYTVDVPISNMITTLLKCAVVGVLFGLTAYLFILCLQKWGQLFTRTIPYPPLRPFVGALLFILLIHTIGNESYLGLGVPTIVDSFMTPMSSEVFILKIVFTTLILGAGFKGGEVTPLFFIGATLGSYLSIYAGLPISLMAALGFVAVFAGATKTPLACTFMGIELFGIEYAILLALVCFVAYFTSGKQSIYSEQFKNKNKIIDIKLK
ncbi:chloride channel protein [Myroides odoratimimus]|uniref:chloride channel protein n=1 Tax=Myroides odoratimimus TaxID=76832 RepID=UPI003100FBB9